MHVKIIGLLGIILCLANASAVSARGDNHPKPDGNNQGNHDGQNQNGGRVVIGVPGTLLFGPRYINQAPPPTVVYGGPYPGYRPDTVGSQPSICVEDRTVYGDGGQIGREDGRRFWTSYPYSVTKKVQVPCR